MSSAHSAGAAGAAWTHPAGPGRRHKSDSGDGGERPSITFADVAGVDEAKEELYELVVSDLLNQ
jgi:ATP-dependent Zn protease